MNATNVSVGFVDASTLQIRFELGEVLNAAQGTSIPEFAPGWSQNADGFVYSNGGWIGRITGPNGEYWQPFDSFTASVIDQIFEDVGGGAPADTAASWDISINGASVLVSGVTRKANILETAESGWGEYEFRMAHNVFVTLPQSLSFGDQIDIGFSDAAFETLSATFDPASTISEAVHVNLIGFDPDDPVKRAFLSSWNGWDASAASGVPQSYGSGLNFDVVDAATGIVVSSGQTALAQAASEANNFAENFYRTDVFEMDFSGVTTPGSYFVQVQDVGRSQTFTIAEGHWKALFDTSFSGFYHQRSGIALEAPYTDYVRPASFVPGPDLEVQRTTVRISETSEGSADYSGGKPFDLFPSATTGDTVDAFGGWHDAGDWDRRTQHLEAGRGLIELMEISGPWGQRDDLTIPEQGDGIPDLLQEAMWGIEVFKRLQLPNEGGIPGGIEQPNYEFFGGASWTRGPVVYAYAPDVWTSWEYAAAAAKVAYHLEVFDGVLAAEWLQSAVDAFAYAEANFAAELPGGLHPRDVTARNIAALEMFRATEDTDYHDVFVATSVYADGELTNIAYNEHQLEAAFLYARMGALATDTTIQTTGTDDLEATGDYLLAQGSTSGFGSILDPYDPYGWQNTAPQPNYSKDALVRLHYLTDDAAYLEAAHGELQYAFGANPLNMVYTTGIDGVRGPDNILNQDADTLGYGSFPGITIYGEYDPNSYALSNPLEWYHANIAADIWPYFGDAPVSESHHGYTGYVPVTEYTVQQGVLDMTVVTGYLAALAGDPAGGGTLGPDTIDGSAAPDALDGQGSDDLIDGKGGNDTLLGGAGQDTIIGGTGDDFADGGADADTVSGGGGADTLSGGGSDDDVDGGPGMDQLTGGDGNDSLLGQGGDDTLRGGAGDDTLKGAANNDLLEGEDGADRLFGELGQDTLHGGDGADWLQGGNANDSITGGSGNDTALGQGNSDTILGGDGADSLDGGASADRLYGEAGDDTLKGGAFNDVLEGGAGNDSLNGGTGLDLMEGAGGNDTLIGGSSGDTLIGGGGDDALAGGIGSDLLIGGGEQDTLMGEAASDTLDGGAGADSLDGGSSADLLRVKSGEGGDTLTGGSGWDDFWFEAGFGTAVITDFELGRDEIDLTTFGGITQFADLSIAYGTNAVIGLGGGDEITLVGIPGELAARDFVIGAAAMVPRGVTQSDGDGRAPLPDRPWETFDEHFAGTIGNDVIVGGDGFDDFAPSRGIDYLFGGDGYGTDGTFNQLTVSDAGVAISDFTWSYDAAVDVLRGEHSSYGTTFLDAGIGGFWAPELSIDGENWLSRADVISLAGAFTFVAPAQGPMLPELAAFTDGDGLAPFESWHWFDERFDGGAFAFDEHIRAGAGDDDVVASPGDDLIDGGSGYNQVTLAGLEVADLAVGYDAVSDAIYTYHVATGRDIHTNIDGWWSPAGWVSWSDMVANADPNFDIG